jgi:hypothetical protein
MNTLQKGYVMARGGQSLGFSAKGTNHVNACMCLDSPAQQPQSIQHPNATEQLPAAEQHAEHHPTASQLKNACTRWINAWSCYQRINEVQVVTSWQQAVAVAVELLI